MCRKEQNQAGNPTTTAETADSSQQIMTGPGPPTSQAVSSGRVK